jgi:hypothetical protein
MNTIETTSPAVETTNTPPVPGATGEKRLLTPALSSTEEEREMQPCKTSAHFPIRHPNISRLPKDVRDMINTMLDERLPYHVLIEELGDSGQGLNAGHLAEWVRGRYQDYVEERQVIDQARASAEFASDLLRELGSTEPSQIYRACQIVAGLQIFDAILEHGEKALEEMLARNPASYLTLLNCACNLSNSAIKQEEHRAKRDEEERRKVQVGGERAHLTQNCAAASP